jgi:4-amino-4-deoxy-L-arabinose transferase-like glycosyltransferase
MTRRRCSFARYPAFLAAILWVTDSQWSISPIQAALSLITVVVTVVIARRVVGPTAGLMAGVLVALDPLHFALSGSILTEGLASLLLISIVAAGVPVFLRTAERVQARYVFALGALIAVATMVRPTTYYLPAIVLVLLTVRFWRLPWRTMLLVLLAFLSPIVAVVGGWQVRNHYAVNSWQVAGAPAATLYCYHAAEVEGQATDQGTRATRQRLRCNPSGWDDLRNVCPSWWPCDARQPLAHGPGFDEMRDRGTAILRQHPVETAE